jgi:hypothetical protein
MVPSCGRCRLVRPCGEQALKMKQQVEVPGRPDHASKKRCSRVDRPVDDAVEDRPVQPYLAVGMSATP